MDRTQPDHLAVGAGPITKPGAVGLDQGDDVGFGLQSGQQVVVEACHGEGPERFA